MRLQSVSGGDGDGVRSVIRNVTIPVLADKRTEAMEEQIEA